ncbi:DNA-binding transcriptional ArsR family regulator [Streptomyces sp. V1I1]|nr:DNA-binding transcriptional ArsR family regulator [Streptomyces sp. V1I1]
MPSLPSEATRRAALRWLAQLRVAGVPRTQVLFTHHPRYADLTPSQYAEGLAWLRKTGMVTAAGRPVVAISETELRGTGAPSAIPHVVWSRAAEEARRKVGTVGEQALLGLLFRGGLLRVRHVAALSDAYGYDIEAALSGSEFAHLEVKSTTDPTRLLVHLTRHEYEVMLTDAEWSMAAVLVGADGSALNVATVSRRWLHAAVPEDRTRNGSWESARLAVPAQAITPGLSMEAGWKLLPDSSLPSRPVWGMQTSGVLV